MPDPLAVAQIICNEVIRELMAKYSDPLRSRTLVSLSSRRRLVRLRRQLRLAQAGFSRTIAEAVTKAVIDELVKEVLHFFRETSIYQSAPKSGYVYPRRQDFDRRIDSYDRWHDSIVENGRRRFAEGHGEERGNFSFASFALGERKTRSHHRRAA